MTYSARASSDGGIVRPRALAVSGLMKTWCATLAALAHACSASYPSARPQPTTKILQRKSRRAYDHNPSRQTAMP